MIAVHTPVLSSAGRLGSTRANASSSSVPLLSPLLSTGFVSEELSPCSLAKKEPTNPNKRAGVGLEDGLDDQGFVPKNNDLGLTPSTHIKMEA